MHRSFTQSNAPEPPHSHTELSGPEKLLRRMQETIFHSATDEKVGALQDLLTSQLPAERRQIRFATDFGVGPPPLISG